MYVVTVIHTDGTTKEQNFLSVYNAERYKFEHEDKKNEEKHKSNIKKVTLKKVSDFAAV